MNKYKADLRIDPFDLENEILKQPQLYYEYSSLAAQAKNDRDDLKDEMEILENQIDSKLRSNPKKYVEDFDGGPLREGQIKSIVKNHSKVKKIRQKYMEARSNANLLDKAEKAFEQRKSMLSIYVQLKIKNMNANVSIPSESQKEFDQRSRREIKNELSMELKRRRR